MKQYEVFQIKFRGKEIAEDQVNVPVKAEFTVGGKTIKVRGFCAGEGTFAVRYLPLETGSCTYRVEYPGADGKTEILEGNEEVAPAESGVHGPVRTDGTAFAYEDGSSYIPFGTTIYALPAQSGEQIEQTLETFKQAPFNKLRMCVFPKYYDFNREDRSCFRLRGERERRRGMERICRFHWRKGSMGASAEES